MWSINPDIVFEGCSGIYFKGVACNAPANFSWQPGYYDTIICTTGQLYRIRKYISDNAQNRDFDV